MIRHLPAVDGTEDAVRRFVAETLGCRVVSLERMTFGHGSVVYKAGLGDRDVIVRTHDDPNLYAGTLTNLDRLRALGLPVPEVLAADLSRSRFPFAAVVTDAFPGRDLRYEVGSMTRSQLSRLAAQIVEFERLAMTLPPGHGYGFLPIGGAGVHDRWIDVVREDRAETLACGTALADLLDRAAPRLDAVAATCFLDDLTIKNVIVHDGVLRGVVDFDVVCYGDPMYWLALAQVAMRSDVGVPGRFYVDELVRFWQPTDEDRANLALYSVLHAAEFLTWDIEDTDRRTRLVAASLAWARQAELPHA